MLLDLFLVVALFYFSIPAVVGYFAKCYGKKFWVWFIYGTFLPVIAHFHLLFTLYLEEERVKKEFKMSLEEERHMHHLIQEVTIANKKAVKKGR